LVMTSNNVKEIMKLGNTELMKGEWNIETKGLNNYNMGGNGAFNQDFLTSVYNLYMPMRAQGEEKSKKETHVTESTIEKREVIFKSEKIRKRGNGGIHLIRPSEDDDETSSENKEVKNPKVHKQQKNKLSARRSRLKKKEYIKSLEEKAHQALKELESYKNLNENAAKFNKSIENLKSKEAEYLLLNEPGLLGSPTVLARKEIIKNDHIQMQTSLYKELVKKLVNISMPLELKTFEKNQPRLINIYAFDSLESLHDSIAANQLILEHIFNLRNTVIDPKSNVFKLYYYYEQLKTMAVKFRDFQFEIGKLNL